jgi:hypothetical protein|tara:strand:+ start:608 stop:1039 length:432 start_codon:yes stop_codon:yes gene_type:complete
MESELDIEQLMKALDNEENEGILKLSNAKMARIKNDMLQKLGLERTELKKLHKKLKDYRYVDEMPDVQFGSYIRWISLKNPSSIKLTNGGIICDIQVKNNGIHIVCRNNMHRFFQLLMSENLIFQKLTEQENVLLSVMDYLNE